MQMTLILNIFEKLALTLGVIGLVGLVGRLIIAFVLSVKTNLPSHCIACFHKGSLGI